MTKQSFCQGSLSTTCPKAPQKASSTLSELSQCCAHTYAMPLQTTKVCKFLFPLQNNRCVIVTVCVSFWSSFPPHIAGERFPMKRDNWKSLFLFVFLFSHLRVVCLYPLSSSNTTLSFSPRTPILPLICCCLCHKEQILNLVIACLFATTPVAVKSVVWERGGELHPLASIALTLYPTITTFVAGVSPQGHGSVIRPMCTRVVWCALIVFICNLERHLLVCVFVQMHVCISSNLAPADSLLSHLLILSTSSPLSLYPEPRPLMKLGVSGGVRLIGQVCPGLRQPVIEVSSKHRLCSHCCTLLCFASTAKTVVAPLSASP